MFAAQRIRKHRFALQNQKVGPPMGPIVSRRHPKEKREGTCQGGKGLLDLLSDSRSKNVTHTDRLTGEEHTN